MAEELDNCLRRIFWRETEYVFLVGAGASIASHIPDGRTMATSILADVIKYLHNRFGNGTEFDENADEFQAEADRHKSSGMTGYQAIMCATASLRTEDWIAKYIRSLILDHARRPAPDRRWIINNCYNVLANIATETRKFARVILTTNFDPLLYYAFIQNWDTEPVLIRHHSELDTMKATAAREAFPCLLYLHGYWQNHLVYNDPQQFNNYRDEWVNGLSDSAWVDNDVIVVGYSGLEDNIAQSWLERCIKRRRHIWWCLYRPSEPPVRRGDGLDTKKKPGLLDKWLDRWMPQVPMTDQEEEDAIRERLGSPPPDLLTFVKTESADDFAVQLGCHRGLNLSQAKRVSAAVTVAGWFRPNDMSEFGNGATITPKTDEPTSGILLEFEMGQDSLPGNNHAGINIDTVEHEVSLQDELNTGKALRVHYELVFAEPTTVEPKFEFKLHSKNNAWSALLPLVPDTGGYCDIPLADFKEKGGIDLCTIWRIVIAADVVGLGIRGKAHIRIKRTEFV